MSRRSPRDTRARRASWPSHENKREPALEPLWISIKTTGHLLNSSRSDIHRKMKDGRLRWCKDGTRTKIAYASVKALVTDPASS